MNIMKVALCCIGRNENRYVREYVEYYRSIGIDKIFIYDNNHDGEEHFEDVIQQYVDDGFVEITDFRNKTITQLNAYQDCYDKHGKEYDWMCFFDFDEFLDFNNGLSIKTFLDNDKFKDYDMIHVNWKTYGDNDLVRYEDKPLRERFTKPKMPLDFKRNYKIPENCHVKSIVRGNLSFLKWINTPHTPIITTKCCDANGKKCDASSPFNEMNFDTAWINHYLTKTLEEWLEVKVKRGYPDGNKDFFKTHSPIEEFFKVNDMNEEKYKFLEENGYIKDNLDLFICTHKDFEPIVKNKAYKVINASTINDDVAENGLKGSFYSEIMSYLYIADNYELKDYIGFCHYRKYFAFLDNVPNIDDVFKNADVIMASPMTFNGSVEGQYAYYHNIEDLKIVEGIIKRDYSDYYDTYKKFINGNSMFPCNMFIMRKDDFLEYAKFMKGVLDKYVETVGTDIEKRILDNKDKYLKSFSPNDTVAYQYRIGGYLAERLTNVFVLKRFKKIICCPMTTTEAKYDVEKNG